MAERSRVVELGQDLTVSRVGTEDLDNVWMVIKSASDWLSTRGMDHWTKYYTREKVEKKLQSQEVYLASTPGGTVATITLDTNPVEYYTQEDMSKFADPKAKAMYVTALSVLPEHQGKGIASKLMTFAENEALSNDTKYLRFDCRASYTDLVDFYKKRGFEVVGEIIDDQDNNEPYFLMEKKIGEGFTKERKVFDGVIRELKETDLPSLKPILETWLKDRTTGQPLPEEVEEDLQLMKASVSGGNDRHYLVAENLDGNVIGVIGFKNPDPRMIPYCKTPNPAELVNAYVSSDQRAGKGVGRALVAKLEEKAGQAGYTEIVLNSGPRYKDSGWGFYDKLAGYQRAGIAVGYYGQGGDAPVWTHQL